MEEHYDAGDKDQKVVGIKVRQDLIDDRDESVDGFREKRI